MSKINNPPNGPVKWGKILQYFLSYFQYWAVPEKTEWCGVEKILFKKKTLKILIFLLYPWKLFQTKQNFTSGNSTKLCLGLKPRTLEIPHNLFLITLGNSQLLLINPGRNSTFHFPSTPWKFHILTPSQQTQ